MTPSIDLIKASDGTGNASIATITTLRAPLATTILVDTTQGIPTSFCGSMGTPHTFVDPVTSETITVISDATAVDFIGHIDGSNLEIDEIAPGYTDLGSAVGDIVIIKPTTQHMDNVAETLAVSHNDDGSIKDAVIDTDNFTAATKQGWITGATAPTATTYLGNRCYQNTYASSILSYKSPGMRSRFTRTVAAPTQCADLELSSTQYFNRASGSVAGTTFTDDFCAGAWIKLESYPAAGTIAAIVSRTNNTSGWFLFINENGQVVLNGHNASISNYSRVASYTSVPLNEWVHVAAQLDMSAFTATSTTSYVMIDGIAVPSAVSRAGTNPTALIQAGDLEVGAASAVTGADAFDGKLAQVFYSSTKITQANMLLLSSQGLTSALCTTHSIVSAYSLSNSLTDINTTNANNLTAQGGALATNADSPFGTQADGTIDANKEYAITTMISSDGLTETVQVPAGCALPTSGGISAVAYSGIKAPYGMPVSKGKWRLSIIGGTNPTQSSPAAGTWYNATVGGLAITVPIGEWDLGWQAAFGAYKSAALAIDAFCTLSTGSSTESDPMLTAWLQQESASSTQGARITTGRSKPISLSAATPYYLNLKTTTASVNAITLYGTSTYVQNVIYADNAYL